MTYDPQKKKNFCSFLRLIATKYQVRQSTLAELIGTTRQYMSLVFKGTALLNAEQFEKVCSAFRDNATEEDLMKLSQLYITAKSSLELNQISLSNKKIDPIKQIIMENLEYLSPQQLIETHKFIEKFKFGNLK